MAEALILSQQEKKHIQAISNLSSVNYVPAPIIEHLVQLSRDFTKQINKTVHSNYFFRTNFIDIDEKALLLVFQAERFRENNALYSQYLKHIKVGLGDRSQLFIDALDHVGVKLSDEQALYINGVSAFNRLGSHRILYLLKNLDKFTRLISEKALVDFFKDFNKPHHYLGAKMNLLPAATKIKLEEIIDFSEKPVIDNGWNILPAAIGSCPQTYSQFKMIFNNVLRDSFYFPYALLRKDLKIIGVLKRSDPYCLLFDYRVSDKNELVSYKGLISYIEFDRVLRSKLFGALDFEDVGAEPVYVNVIDIQKEDIEMIPVATAYRLKEEQNVSDYFTVENIGDKIGAFVSAAEKLISQKPLKIFEYKN